jgi:hypothetical protein
VAGASAAGAGTRIWLLVSLMVLGVMVVGVMVLGVIDRDNVRGGYTGDRKRIQHLHERGGEEER